MTTVGCQKFRDCLIYPLEKTSDAKTTLIVLERKVNCSLPQRGRARVGAIISAGKGVFVQAIDKQGAKCLHALNRVRYYAWKKK
jgi:hypothetical protein